MRAIPSAETFTVVRDLIRVLDALIRFTSVVGRVGSWFAGALFVIAAAVVSVEVFIRKAFNWSITGIDELSGFALAMGISWGLAFALIHRAHIRIDTLLVILPLKLRAVLDIFGTLLFAGYMLIVARQGMVLLFQSIESDARATTIPVPMMIPQAVWVAGIVFFVVVAGLLLLRALVAVLSRDVGTVERLMGSRSVMAESSDNTRQVADDEAVGRQS